MISKPNKIFKIFGSLASRGAYSMTGFGSLNPVSVDNNFHTNQNLPNPLCYCYI